MNVSQRVTGIADRLAGLQDASTKAFVRGIMEDQRFIRAVGSDSRGITLAGQRFIILGQFKQELRYVIRSSDSGDILRIRHVMYGYYILRIRWESFVIEDITQGDLI